MFRFLFSRLLKLIRQLFVSGADLHKVDLAITSSVSAVNISRLSMSPGVRYYSNVVANTLSGLQTTVSSDGIMVDSTSPVSGTVYDGLGMYLCIVYIIRATNNCVI